MHSFGVREVEKLLRLPRSTIRGLVQAGFVSPSRGPGRAWRFSFQDLIVLRTAQALAAANVPKSRITRSMKALRRSLPAAMPLSGLSIAAVADRVVVREGPSRWQADSGQYLLAFEGDPAAGSLRVVERRPPPVEDRYERALALEESDPEAAVRAYEEALAENPAHLDACLNLGCLLHQKGHLARAEAVYRAGLQACGDQPSVQFNLGVLLEDQGRKDEACAAYEAAIAGDPRFADCHYNLALLCEQLQRPRDAIRHMAQYRKLTARK